MSNMKAVYLGDEQVEVTHGPTGKTLITDLPPDNGGKGRTFSPTDLLTCSLSSCVLTIMAKMAEKDGENLKGTSITFEKTMSDTPPRRVAKITGLICFSTHLSTEKKTRYLTAIKACPVHRSLHPDIEINFKSE